MTHVLHSRIPYDALSPAKLPGIAPLNMADWLLVDEAYAGQMAMRRNLLMHQREAVAQTSEVARPAASELLSFVLKQIAKNKGFEISDGIVLCPDGVQIPVVEADPLTTLGQLVQQDFCLMQKVGEEHVLTGAVLCFPASWTLSEKLMRPLVAIHDPVPEYAPEIAKRVQRLFDGVQVGRPLWRKNALWYDSPELFTPRSETDPREEVPNTSGLFLRSERQALLRLPETNVVVFSIHTYMVPRDRVAKTGGQPE